MKQSRLGQLSKRSPKERAQRAAQPCSHFKQSGQIHWPSHSTTAGPLLTDTCQLDSGTDKRTQLSTGAATSQEGSGWRAGGGERRGKERRAKKKRKKEKEKQALPHHNTNKLTKINSPAPRELTRQRTACFPILPLPPPNPLPTKKTKKRTAALSPEAVGLNGQPQECRCMLPLSLSPRLHARPTQGFYCSWWVSTGWSGGQKKKHEREGGKGEKEEKGQCGG